MTLDELLDDLDRLNSNNLMLNYYTTNNVSYYTDFFPYDRNLLISLYYAEIDFYITDGTLHKGYASYHFRYIYHINKKIFIHERICSNKYDNPIYNVDIDSNIEKLKLLNLMRNI